MGDAIRSCANSSKDLRCGVAYGLYRSVWGIVRHIRLPLVDNHCHDSRPTLMTVSFLIDSRARAEDDDSQLITVIIH
jgi:hypothetical protein